MRRSALDYVPLVTLVVFWGTAGLAGAITVARVDGSPRCLVLGVVTVPALLLIARAARRLRHAPPPRPPS